MSDSASSDGAAVLRTAASTGSHVPDSHPDHDSANAHAPVSPDARVDRWDGAFEEFFRAHQRDAVRWAIALVGDRAVAEELAQDALAAVGARLGAVDEPAAYLRRTVANRAASWHRSLGRERRRMRRVAAGQPTAYTAETNEMLDALGALPYKQRAAVSLRFWADWTDDDIAAALGCAPASVRVLVHRGLAALRKELER